MSFYTSRFTKIRKNSFERHRFAHEIILNAFYDEKVSLLINILPEKGHCVKNGNFSIVLHDIYENRDRHSSPPSISSFSKELR